MQTEELTDFHRADFSTRLGLQRRKLAAVLVRAAAAAPTKVAEKQYKLGGNFELKVAP